MTEPNARRKRVKITDELAERLADDAERGYDLEQVHLQPTGRGRPRLAEGNGPSPTVNARLDDELSAQLAERAKRDGVAKSDIVREALRAWLD